MPAIHRRILNRALFEYYSWNNSLENQTPLKKIQFDCIEWFTKQLTHKVAKTKIGSLEYLLWGQTYSRESIYDIMKDVGKFLINQMINYVPHLELIDTKIVIPNSLKIDTSSYISWINHDNKTVYTYNIKTTRELDIMDISNELQQLINMDRNSTLKCYNSYKSSINILNWTIYQRSNLKDQCDIINKYESLGIHVAHMKDIIDLLEYKWSEEEFNNFFHKLGSLCN